MIDKTRSEFMGVILANKEERDLSNTNFSLFQALRPLSYYTIKYGDIGRPDLISQRVYGTVKYWWIICKFNQIDDVWNDIKAGVSIKLPNIQDIKEFYSSVDVN